MTEKDPLVLAALGREESSGPARSAPLPVPASAGAPGQAAHSCPGSGEPSLTRCTAPILSSPHPFPRNQVIQFSYHFALRKHSSVRLGAWSCGGGVARVRKKHAVCRHGLRNPEQGVGGCTVTGCASPSPSSKGFSWGPEAQSTPTRYPRFAPASQSSHRLH